MNWTTLAPILLAAGGTLGLSELLKLLVTRSSRRATDQKVQAETGAVVSGQLLGWTTQAEARAARAEQRADRAEARVDETEQRLQTRIDEMGVQLDGMKQDLQRMRLLIRDCTAGPPCPVRIAIDRAVS